MRISKAHCLAAALALSLAGSAFADVWDVQTDNDDAATTDNELLHGMIQTHDLGVRPGPVPDQDWYLMPQRPRASYEVIIDGASGDIGYDLLALDRIAPDGATVLQTHESVMFGATYSRALRWVNTNTNSPHEFVRVSGGACGTDCGSDDVYTIRVRETTVNLARFNNSGSQVTVLLTQNATERPIHAVFYYWSANGTLLQTGELVDFPAKNLNVFPLTSWPTLVGQAGHITVAHDAGYGGLVIKTVALEPTTGFSFDTPGVYVPN
jgi:hypothetical protein